MQKNHSMKRVFLTCGPANLEFFDRTMLRRESIELATDPNLETSLKSVACTPPDLFIIRDTFGKELEKKLRDFAKNRPEVPFPVAVISESARAPDLPPMVKKVIPAAIEVPIFNDVVAELLNLPTRKSVRLQLSISLSNSGESVAASTVNISGSGMLVESPKPFLPGATYHFRFTGEAAAGLPSMPVKVIREEVGAASHLCALEFVGISVEEMEKILKMLA